jgi:hypothetical protein
MRLSKSSTPVALPTVEMVVMLVVMMGSWSAGRSGLPASCITMCDPAVD